MSILAVGLVAAVYFLLQGKLQQGSTITTQMESGLEAVVGKDFDVRLGEVDLDFSQIGNIRLKSSDITIVRRTDGELLAEVGSFEVSTRLTSVLSGETKFEFARIDEARLDAGILGAGQALLLPANLRTPLDVTGNTLARLHKQFTADGFESFEIYNSLITGPVMGRKKQDPVSIDRLLISPRDANSFFANGEFSTELSEISYTSNYAFSNEENTARYEFHATGIHLGEWLADPTETVGAVGSDGVIELSGALPFDSSGLAMNPDIKLVASKSTLRIGRDTSEVRMAELKLRLLLEKNQIELDPSEVELGRLKATVVGGIKPFNATEGYHGPLRYDLIMQRGEFEPTLVGEPIVPAAFKIAGIYDREMAEIDVQRLVLTTQNGSILGSGSIGLAGETPAIKATASTDGISVATLKQFWPFFVAHGARKWIHEHIIDGWVSAGTVTADVPPGIVFRMREGAKFKPEHFKTELALENLKFRPFGEMPPISKAKGTVVLEGMKISADMTSGEVSGFGTRPVQISSGSFVLEDFAAKERWGQSNLELDGEIRAISQISDRKPLRVLERMNVVPDQFSGEGHANIAARFPVGRKAKYEEVEWNVLLEMSKGSSSKKLSGRKLSDADLLIDANPTGAKVTGSMNIDGVNARVDFTEPIGKSGKVKKKREIRAVLDEKERKTLGIDLNPVIEGPVGMVALQSGNTEKYSLDFTKAKIALPWAGWSKGANIPAKGEFVLKKQKSSVKLEDFRVVGPGFEGQGTLVLDKRGLVSADLSKLKLNEQDDLRLKVERTKSAYNINAAGLSYDARGIINTLIHKGGFTKAQGDRSVNLVANFDTVMGFNNRVMRNAILLYESKSGRLNKLDLKGEGSEGRTYNVQAQLNGNQTLFTVKSSDAGTTLAFMNVYTRMQGGVLEANLIQSENGPYLGPVRITDFTVVNEPKLKSIASSVRRQIPQDRGELKQVIPDGEDRKVKFLLADAQIERGKGYFEVTDAIVRSTTMGITMNGMVYDPKDRMNITGTFMPANGVNLAVSAIPLLSQLFSNGKDRALIGVTYQLKGPRTKPEMTINPLSIVTPGVFNKVFEFKQ
ncbi:MAG: DUF3971 domain-containing protein [Pseudomonadota bacterium]